MTEPGPILDARGVCKSFGALEALKGVDLTVARQELVFIIGSQQLNQESHYRLERLLLQSHHDYAKPLLFPAGYRLYAL